MMTTYSVQMTDSETPAAWMGAPWCKSAKPGAQDSGRVRFTVVVIDDAAAKAAWDADDSVLSYEVSPVRVCDYQTGATLDGAPSERLRNESAAERSGTGAVGAYRDDAGVWQWCDESDARRTHVVYVEA